VVQNIENVPLNRYSLTDLAPTLSLQALVSIRSLNSYHVDFLILGESHYSSVSKIELIQFLLSEGHTLQYKIADIFLMFP